MWYSESDTRAKFIDPQLKQNGRDETNIIREHRFTDGRKLIGGKRSKQCFADYILRYNNKNIAIIEAKREDKEITEWLEQVKDYANKLHIRFVYATNGKWIYEFDMENWRWQIITNYPTPKELRDKTFEFSNTIKDTLLNEPFHLVGSMKPRYYQELAVTKTMESLADGKDRILLTLATGTGKTFIAFQIVWKLFQAKRSRHEIGARRPRILFLADRNILVDQAMNTFNPIEKNIIKVNWKEIKKRWWKVPYNANVFFAIYQAIIWNTPETEEDYEENDIKNYFKQYDPDFFDMIIIDECHRGWANEKGSWHEILKHFSPAIHVGLTATPKREDNIDTYDYFWDPIFEYSLKDGINDGFLTPYKVKRIKTNIDEIVLNSWDTILKWEQKKDVYEIKDMEREIIIQERSDLIAQAILQNIDPMQKTIIFCVDQGHALRIRDSINKYKTISDPDYCVRVVSDEWDIWRTYLERFQDNDKDIPTILTSSQMLTTWVDAKNVRNIVLIRNIWSMVEFKQIIGRGTRVFEGKDFFTILDFTGATNKFYDDTRDGDPTEIETKEINQKDLSFWAEWNEVEESVIASDSEAIQKTDPSVIPAEAGISKQKLVVRLADDRILKIIDIETRYTDETGRPLSATEFLQKLVWNLPNLYETEQQLRDARANPDTREELLIKLQEMWVDGEQLDNLKLMFDGNDSDIFDILAHISFNTEIKKRVERVAHVKGSKLLFSQYEDLKAKEFLEFLLEKYQQNGVNEIGKSNLQWLVQLFKKGSVPEIAGCFGGGEKLREAYYELQKELYEI